MKSNDDWLFWYLEQVERERELDWRREMNLIRGIVCLICLIVAAVYEFAKYWN